MGMVFSNPVLKGQENAFHTFSHHTDLNFLRFENWDPCSSYLCLQLTTDPLGNIIQVAWVCKSIDKCHFGFSLKFGREVGLLLDLNIFLVYYWFFLLGKGVQGR